MGKSATLCLHMMHCHDKPRDLLAGAGRPNICSQRCYIFIVLAYAFSQYVPSCLPLHCVETARCALQAAVAEPVKPQPIGPDPTKWQQTQDFPEGTRLTHDEASLLLSGLGFHAKG